MAAAWIVAQKRGQIQTLAGCVLVALVSGTNYVYSAYAPQLGQKLNLSHTQLNIIGIAGNVGTYCFAPISGWVIDKRGYHQPMFVASLLLFVGYGGIRYLFSHASPADESGSWLVMALSICSFATGAGGIFGVYSATNAGIKNVHHKLHASVNGVMSSAFGLSAFLFSFVAKEFFAGQTTSFLNVLMLGTSVPILLGATLVRPVSIPEGTDDDLATTGRREEDEPFLAGDEQRVGDNRGQVGESGILEFEPDTRMGDDQRQDSEVYLRTQSSLGSELSSDQRSMGRRDVHGWELFTMKDFWIFTGILGFVCAPGLVYINNVGAIVQALYANKFKEWDKAEAAAAQAAQVSIISICGFWGRLAIGFLADYSNHSYGIPRQAWAVLSSILGVSAQWMLTRIDDPNKLWRVSAFIGISYGTPFVIITTLVLQSFGIAHFSRNAGFTVLSSVILGNIFNYGFGRNLDSHSIPPSQGNDELGFECLEGPACYTDSVYMTLGSCCLGLGLSMYALVHRRAI